MGFDDVQQGAAAFPYDVEGVELEEQGDDLEVGQDAEYDAQQEEDDEGVARELPDAGQVGGAVEEAGAEGVDEPGGQEVASEQGDGHGAAAGHGELEALGAAPTVVDQGADEDAEAAQAYHGIDEGGEDAARVGLQTNFLPGTGRGGNQS